MECHSTDRGIGKARGQFDWDISTQNASRVKEWILVSLSSDRMRSDRLYCQQKIKKKIETLGVSDTAKVYLHSVQRDLEISCSSSMTFTGAYVYQKTSSTRWTHSFWDISFIGGRNSGADSPPKINALQPDWKENSVDIHRHFWDLRLWIHHLFTANLTGGRVVANPEHKTPATDIYLPSHSVWHR